MSYTKNTWETGDAVTAEKLNNMEDGIAGAGSASNIISIPLEYDSDESQYILRKGFEEMEQLCKNKVVFLYYCLVDDQGSEVYTTSNIYLANGTWYTTEGDELGASISAYEFISATTLEFEYDVENDYYTCLYSPS